MKDWFRIDEDTAAAPREALAAAFTVEAAAARHGWRRFLDTFDWRLHRAGLVCVRDARECRLEQTADGAVTARAPLTDSDLLRFAGDAPSGPLRKLLRRHLKMRALVSLVSLQVESAALELRNRDGKMVVRAEDAVWRLPRPEGTDVRLRTLRLLPVRGYEKALARARRICSDAGATPLTRPPLGWALREVGLLPGAYSSGFAVELTSDLPARTAARAIFQVLLDAMRANEEGLKADIDTEFLHDFRVAIRRTRSALGQLGDVFPADVTAGFKREFAALGRATGPLRDLDVHLLAEDATRALLPRALRPGLDPLYERLRGERAEARRHLLTVLASDEYVHLLTRWKAALSPADGDDLPATETAGRPIGELAAEQLRRRHAKLLARGRGITGASPDRHLHRLRIDGKKLRYLLEFFASLYPDDRVQGLVKQLKRLQDNLGDFNDLSVQRAWLRDDLAALARRRGRQAVAEAAAVGGLLTVLADRQRAVRRDFARCFASFDDPEVTAVCADLFGAQPAGEAQEATS